MSVVGPIAAKILQGRQSSEVFLLQQNSLVIRSSRPHRRTSAIRGTEVMERQPASWATSLHLDVRGPDDFAPLLGFIGDELAEPSGRHRRWHNAQINKPSSHLGIAETGINAHLVFTPLPM
jgi:hypothetical protein